MPAGIKVYGRKESKMSFLSKIRKNKLLKNAFKSANDPIWFVEYETQDDKGQVNVYAKSHREAVKAADNIIMIQNGDKPYKIINTSCV